MAFSIILLILNSFFLSAHFSEKKPFAHFLLLFLIFFYSQILGFSTLLGLLNLLSPLFFFLSLFLLSIFLILRKSFKKISFGKYTISPESYLSICIVLSIYIVVFRYNLVLPPLATDGLLYHLPFALHYIKTHSVSIPSLFFSDIAMSYYPIGGDIFYSLCKKKVRKK